MLLTFNSVLTEGGLNPRDVRMLRHKDKRAEKGRTPYELWRTNRPEFESYQSTQGFDGESKLNAPYWASFVGTPNGETVFVGVYAVKFLGPLRKDRVRPHMQGIDKAGSCNEYELTLLDIFKDLDGRLVIEWGEGYIAWVQGAEKQNKTILELRRAFQEPEFPGFLNFIEPLSKIDSLPITWVAALKSARGVYLLTCPKTKEQYVGSAYGEEAFWHRWQSYVLSGHGGNIALRSRDPSDYQVSILEVAGSAASSSDIINMEQHWKAKLQSREMGLNRN